MKYSMKISLAILTITIFTCLALQSPLITKPEYKRLMETAGSDWDVKFEDHEIIITSKVPCWFFIAVSLPVMEPDQFVSYVKGSGRQDYYEIHLHFVSKWDEEKTSAAETHNEKIWEEIISLPEKHGVAHLMQTKTNSYLPETEEDEKRVAEYDKEYETLLEQLIRMPDFQSEKYSIFINDNKIGFEGVWNEDITFINISDIFGEQ